MLPYTPSFPLLPQSWVDRGCLDVGLEQRLLEGEQAGTITKAGPEAGSLSHGPTGGLGDRGHQELGARSLAPMLCARKESQGRCPDHCCQLVNIKLGDALPAYAELSPALKLFY